MDMSDIISHHGRQDHIALMIMNGLYKKKVKELRSWVLCWPLPKLDTVDRPDCMLHMYIYITHSCI